MTPKDIKKILKLRKKGHNTREIASMLNLSAFAVGKVQPEGYKRVVRDRSKKRPPSSDQVEENPNSNCGLYRRKSTGSEKYAFPGFDAIYDGECFIRDVVERCPTCGAKTQQPCLVCWLRKSPGIGTDNSDHSDMTGQQAKQYLQLDLPDEECMARYEDVRMMSKRYMRVTED